MILGENYCLKIKKYIPDTYHKGVNGFRRSERAEAEGENSCWLLW